MRQLARADYQILGGHLAAAGMVASPGLGEQSSLMPVDPDFRRPALVDRIVRGTTESDPVRLHGAIVAALELYGRDDAVRQVFVPALRRIQAAHGRPARNRASGAVRDQLGSSGYQSSSV